ncbi:hypothetical protein BKA70DRAFT_468062 [Coprinopsis sp. MPI-PUGE-AT-0042]|nr:hypothetical protein BKA70DRAFT_468062 [Coprinopsis sp. MPI-PUGE-AT-0042]
MDSEPAPVGDLKVATLKASSATNAIPLASDITALSNHLKSLPQELGQVEAEITELKLCLASLEIHKTDLLQEQHLPHTSINSPIHKLPTELIVEILKARFPDALNKGDRSCFLSLRSVCKMWREAAFTTPDLWDRLEITLGCETLTPRWDVAGVISRWFDRAGDLPLTFKVTRGRYKYSPDHDIQLNSMDISILQAIYTSVFPQSRNWHELHLPDIGADVLFGSSDEASAAPSCNTPWGRLEHLTLPFMLPSEGPAGEEWPFPRRRLDKYAPALATLSVTVKPGQTRSPNGNRKLRIGLHHNHLRSLTVEIPTALGFVVDAFLQLVPSLPGLRTLKLKVSLDPVERIRLNVKPVISPDPHFGIRSLSLTGSGIVTLKHLTLPNLRHLVIHELIPNTAVVDALLSLLSRSNCELRELHVHLSMSLLERSTWRKIWAPLCDVMGLQESLVREDGSGMVTEGAWIVRAEAGSTNTPGR